MWNLTWIGLLVLALCIGLFTFFYHTAIPGEAFIALVVVANLFVAAAIIIDATKLRTLREDWERQLSASSKSKAARAEQKRLRALERERAKARANGELEPEPVDESGMSFRERLAYRAQKSAEAANVKGSGL